MSWQTSQLRDLCLQVTSGGTPPTAHSEYYDGDIPWLRTHEVNFNRIFETEIRITEQGLANSTAKWLPENTVIVAMYGNSAGRVALARIPLTTNQACCNLIIDPRAADERFVFYRLLLDYERLHQMAKGSAQNNLNATQLKSYLIKAPAVQQQRAIGKILSAYDDLIENNRRRMVLLEQAAGQLYREWFVRLRFPGYEHTRIVDGVPNGWERRTLASLCVADGIQTGPFGSQLHQSDYTDEGVPVVMPKDLIDYRVSVATIARIPEDLANRLGRHRMIADDIVYGRRGDIGRRAFISSRQAGFFCGTGCLRIRANPREVNPRYLFDALGAPETAGTIANRAKGSTMLNLNGTVLKTVPILVAPRSLQNLYAQFVTPSAALTEVLDEQNQKLRTARDLLLPRLMSGEITV